MRVYTKSGNLNRSRCLGFRIDQDVGFNVEDTLFSAVISVKKSCPNLEFKRSFNVTLENGKKYFVLYFKRLVPFQRETKYGWTNVDEFILQIQFFFDSVKRPCPRDHPFSLELTSGRGTVR